MTYLILLLLLLIPQFTDAQVTTTTPNLGLTKPCVPGDAGCLPTGHPGWGPIVNTDFDIIDAKVPTLNLTCTDGQFPIWANNKFSVCGTPASVSTITGGAFALSGDITPSQITSDQNNYNPTGLSTASVLRLSTDASRAITGLAGGADGRLMFIYNAGSNALTLTNESGSSTEANRFAINANITLSANQGIIVQYDSTSSRWRAASGISGGGGGQSADDDLTAIAALSGTGILVHTGTSTWAERQITNTGGGLTITNPAGVAGNINIDPGSALVRNDASTTATSGSWNLAGLTSLGIPASSGCGSSTTDGHICRNTTTGDWHFTRSSIPETLVARSDMDAKTHASLPDLDEDQHPFYTGFDAAAGNPAATSVPRAGWFHINTTPGAEDLFFGTAAAGNYVRAGARLDRINQFTNGTLSASASGPEAVLVAVFTSLSAKTLTLARTETYANQPASGTIEIYASGASTQNCVVFGWTAGGDSSAGVTETITLNGTTPVPSVKTDWEDIYAVHCPDNTSTTVSFRTDTGDLPIGSVASGATHSANQLSVFIQAAASGGTSTQYREMRLDSVENGNANANANSVGTTFEYATVRYEDGVTGTSYWSAYIPVASTSWNMVLHNKPSAGTGTAVSLEISCRAVNDNEAWDSTMTWIHGTSGNPAEITVSSTSANLNVNVISSTLPLGARDRLICNISRVGGDANDNLGTTWDLTGVSLEITP